jgi:hypothetical protein
MSQVNMNSSVGGIASAIELGPNASLQLRFAKLQLALSEMSKQSAMKEIDSIEKAQEEQKKVAAQAPGRRQRRKWQRPGQTEALHHAQ